MDNKSCFRLMYTKSRQWFSSISIQYDNYLAWEKCVLLRISSVIFQVEHESRNHSTVSSRLIQPVGSVHGDLRQLDLQHHVIM